MTASISFDAAAFSRSLLRAPRFGETPLERELVSFTSELAFELGAVRRLIDGSSPGRSGFIVKRRTKPEVLARRLYPMFATWLDPHLLELGRLAEDLSDDRREELGCYFRRELRAFSDASAFLARMNARPRGYAADSVAMGMIHDEALVGETTFGRVLHFHGLQSDAAKSVRYRGGLVASMLRARARESGATTRVLSVGCSAARELRSIYLDDRDAQRIEMLLVDQDEGALADAADEIALVQRRFERKLNVTTQRLRARDLFAPGVSSFDALGRHEAIYALGLLDQLDGDAATRVVTRLFDRLAPGGLLVLSSFHEECRSRAYLDVWMDWPIVYRTEEDVLSLAELVDSSSRRVERDPTGSQMFLSLRK